jgi:hypothetical protein
MKRLIPLYIFLVACHSTKITAPPPVEVVQHPKKDSITEEKKTVPVVKDKNFDLTVLLSLNVQRYLEKDTADNYVLPELDQVALNALSFYQGMLLAQKADDHVKLNVVDAGIDSSVVLKNLKSTCKGAHDLVISIINPSLNTVAANIAQIYNCRMLLPLSGSAVPLDGHNKVWMSVPSNKTQCRQMTLYIKEKQKGAEYIIISRDNKKENDLADLFYTELINAGVDSVHCKKVKYIDDNFAAIEKVLKKDRKNILFLPVSDESFISSLLAKLDIHEEYDLMLVGLPTWEYFESIDINLLESLNTLFFSAAYIDYSNEDVKKFRNLYINTYHADPVYTAYEGFDIYNWIVENNSKNGTVVEKYEGWNTGAVTSGLDFKKPCDNCGYENQSITILKFKEALPEKADR